MKKFFIMAAVALCVGMTVTSCGDDDPVPANPANNNGGDNNNDDNNGGDNTGGDTTGRKIVTNISNKYDGMYWTYSNNGVLSSFGTGYHNFVLTGESYVWQDENHTEIISDIKRNADGFVTSFAESYTSVNSDSQKSTAVLNYYGRNLTSGTITLTGKDNGESFSDVITYALDWTNGNLTQITQKWVGQYEGETETVEEKCVITYGTQKNVYKQYPFELAGCIEDDYYMAVTGWLGDGPVNLPVRYTFYENGELDGGSNYVYTQNPDGSIATEVNVYDGDEDDPFRADRIYYYTYLGDQARANVKAANARSQELVKSLMSKALRRHKHLRK